MDDSGRPVKIVFLIGSLEGGGAARVFLTLLRHLDRRHFEPHLVLRRAEGEFLCQVPKDVFVHSLGETRHRAALPGLLLSLGRLVRLLWRLRPAVVFSTGGMNLASLLARPLLPPGTRLLVRECSVLNERLNHDTRFPRIWTWLYRHTYRRADKVVCQSDSMVRDMRERFRLPQQRSVRIYNPVDAELVREAGKSVGNPYAGAGPNIVAAGRFSSEKGFDLLMAAMPQILQRFPAARLTLLGCGPLKATLLEQAEKLGVAASVSFPGFQQNPWPYLCHADLFVVPSRREAFSNVLLEALVLGTPAVAVDCPGAIREIYSSHPAVKLVPAGDPGRLAQAIIERCREAKPKTSSDWLAKFALPNIISEYSTLFLQS